MCAQLEVLKKVREKKEINGFGVELAEAQMKDYVAMNKKVEKIEKDVSGIKKDMTAMKTEQAVQGGKLDLIIQRLNSPVEEERKDGLVWHEIKRIVNTPLGKTIILLFIFCLGLAGQRLMELTGLIQ